MNAPPPSRAAKKFGLLGCVGTDDLGDAIQGVAARQFLPNVGYQVDREGMNLFGSAETGKVWLIANGWFLQNPENWPPSQYIRPLFVSMHISGRPSERTGLTAENVILTEPAVKYLRSYGPIGARDLHTLDLLRRADVDSYFSGCLTLTLERPPIERQDDLVVLNDVPEQVARHVRLRTSKRLAETSHSGLSEGGVESRFARAEELLQLYAQASCVITTRLHGALPSLAFGTPVLLLDTGHDRYRLTGLIDFLNHCSIDEFVSGQTAFDIDRPPPNADRHKSFAEALRRRVLEFVELPEATDPHPYPLSLSDRYAIIAATQAKALQIRRQRKTNQPELPATGRLKTVLLQTSDAHVYADILQETARVNRLYCARHKLEYRSFIGIKRGYHPWQATFNRIPLLVELQQAGNVGWVIYLDADAYVYDVGFDVHTYLAQRADRACIVARGADQGKWDVNAGVLFINLQHPLGRRLVALWATAFATALPDQALLASAGPWSARVDDQSLLQQVLRDNQDILDATLVEREGVINYTDGLFIRQVLRSAGNSMPQRLQRAAHDIRAALSRVPASNPNSAALAANHDAASVRLYGFLFEQWRNRSFSLVHIGPLANARTVEDAEIPRLEAANFASIQAWLDYFPQAHCFDVNAFSENDEELSRISFVYPNLTRADGWRLVASEVPPLGIVLDTGVHGALHQQRAFLALFPRLQSGGHYVIDGLARPPGDRPLASAPRTSTADLFLGYLTGETLAVTDVKPYEIDECVRRIGQVYIDRPASGASDSGAVQRVVVVARN